ncbi:MAG: hypothetical protein KF781_01225 [Chitinophagaceae bacterium]|nr:hypothetical protein [Chitinophagaceae bacterium]MCW5905357.1 hypothetical protein [Chitinophagaceae bacterium]
MYICTNITAMQTVVRKANNTTPKKLVVKKATAKKAANGKRISNYPKGSYEALVAAANYARKKNLKSYS